METMFLSRKLLYLCELKIDGKTIDRKKTDDYGLWYDRITDKVYEANRFKKIEIKIKICNP